MRPRQTLGLSSAWASSKNNPYQQKNRRPSRCPKKRPHEDAPAPASAGGGGILTSRQLTFFHSLQPLVSNAPSLLEMVMVVCPFGFPLAMMSPNPPEVPLSLAQ